MERIDALKELAAKVSRGTADPDDFSEVTLNDSANSIKIAGAWRAYNENSLDAAMRFHKAAPTPGAIMSAADAKLVLFDRDGARHFLAWKIRALIAKEGE